MNININDAYCIKITRFGALGLEETPGAVHMHARTDEEIKEWLDLTLKTLGPGDRAEITLTRGLQTEESVSARETLYGALAEPAPDRPHGGIHPPLPGDDHPEW